MITVLICVAISLAYFYRTYKGYQPYEMGLLAIITGLALGIMTALTIGSFLPTQKILTETETIQCGEKGGTKTCLYAKPTTLQYYVVKKDFGAGIMSQEMSTIGTAIVEQNRSDAILETSTEIPKYNWRAWFGIGTRRQLYTFLIPKGSIKQVSEVKTTGETP